MKYRLIGNWCKRIMAGHLLLSVLTATALAADPLPFAETFEDRTVGNLHGQNGWEADPSDSAKVQADEVYADSKAASIGTGTVTHAFTDPAGTNVSVDCYSIITRRSMAGNPVPDPKSSAVFYVNSSGHVVALSNSTWVTFAGVTVPDGSWARVTIDLNYPTETWSIDIDGGHVAEGLKFQSSSTNTTVGLMRVTDSNSVSYLDNVDVDVAGGEPECTTRGTPHTWLDSFDLTDYENDDIEDQDNDGAPAWQEYYAGTDPTNVRSRFAILDMGVENGSNYVSWYGTTNSGYTADFWVYRSTNIVNGTWDPVKTDFARSDTGTNTWYDDTDPPQDINIYYMPAAPTNGP